jgi:hypothetical protein
MERALFLATAAGLEADGFGAPDAPVPWRLRVRSRKSLARVRLGRCDGFRSIKTGEFARTGSASGSDRYDQTGALVTIPSP